jgi:Cupin-like domain
MLYYFQLKQGDEIKRLNEDPLPTVFAQYLTWSTPVVFGGFADKHDAVINLAIVNQSSSTASLNVRRVGGVDVEPMKIVDFVKSCSDEGAHNYYVGDEPVPATLYEDLLYPAFARGVEAALTSATMDLSCSDVVVPLHYDGVDTLMTVFEGNKTITLVAPWDAANAYLSSAGTYAAVDPLNVDEAKFPKFKNAKVFTVKLEAGESILIPAYWFRHIQSFGDNIAVTFGWNAASKPMEIMLSKALNEDAVDIGQPVFDFVEEYSGTDIHSSFFQVDPDEEGDDDVAGDDDDVDDDDDDDGDGDDYDEGDDADGDDDDSFAEDDEGDDDVDDDDYDDVGDVDDAEGGEAADASTQSADSK